MLRTGNPTLQAETFSPVVRATGEEAMTLAGTVNKTGISLLILLAFAAMAWNGVLGRGIHASALDRASGEASSSRS